MESWIRVGAFSAVSLKKVTGEVSSLYFASTSNLPVLNNNLEVKEILGLLAGPWLSN